MPKVSCDFAGNDPPRQATSPATSVTVQPSLGNGRTAVTSSGTLMRSAIVGEPSQPCATRKPAVNEAPATAVLGWATTCARAAATEPATSALAMSTRATSAVRKNDMEISLRRKSESDARGASRSKASGEGGRTSRSGGPVATADGRGLLGRDQRCDERRDRRERDERDWRSGDDGNVRQTEAAFVRIGRHSRLTRFALGIGGGR